jgi:hypothetical protein
VEKEMSSNQFENDADRRAYEALLARQAWGHPERVEGLGEAVLDARRRAGAHGGVLTGREMIDMLREPTAERARELYRQALIKLLTRKAQTNGNK